MCLQILALATQYHCSYHLGCATCKVTGSSFIFVFPEPTTESVGRIVLSLRACVLVKLHGVPPSEINNLRENRTEVQLYTGPRITLHIKSFTTKNICLGFLHISAHKCRSSSSVISSHSHESLFPQFFSVQLQGRACSNTIVQVWREWSV